MKQPYFLVCMPAYNSEKVISETLRSLQAQTFANWECLIVDDGSADNTEQAVLALADERISFVRNDVNLGYPGNLQRCFDLANRGEVIYLLAQDDILSPIALQRTYDAFQLAPDIAVVTRPYFIFENDPDQPIRYEKQFGLTEDWVISPRDYADNSAAWVKIFSTLSQLSSLAFKRALIVGGCNPWVFTAHVEQWLETLKRHRGVFLKDYPLAVRKGTSQSRHVSAIYEPSPLWSWVDLFDRVFPGKEWRVPRKVGRDFKARNAEGLVQVRCSSTLTNFFREAFLYAYYRPLNLISVRYWFYVLGCLLLPRRGLRCVTDRLTPFFCKPRGSEVVLSR